VQPSPEHCGISLHHRKSIGDHSACSLYGFYLSEHQPVLKSKRPEDRVDGLCCAAEDNVPWTKAGQVQRMNSSGGRVMVCSQCRAGSAALICGLVIVGLTIGSGRTLAQDTAITPT